MSAAVISAAVDHFEDADFAFLEQEFAKGAEDAAAREARMERLRNNARESRKRKREREELMKEEVEALRAGQLKETSGRKEESLRIESLRAMNNMLDSKCEETELVKRLRSYAENYADFGETRIERVKMLTAQLEQQLLPTQASKMLLWVLQQQEDDFYSDSNPIWNVLCKKLDLDEQQKAYLKEQRRQLGQQNAHMKKTLMRLHKFKNVVLKNMELRRKQIENLVSVISPQRTIRFLQWAEDNQACIHMLNGLWSIRDKPK